MNIIEEHDKVTLSFSGKFDNGELFTEVPEEKPMIITIGNSELPPSVELGIMGLKAGDQKVVRVPPEESYGPRLKDLIHDVPIDTFGDRIKPVPGMILSQKIEKEGTLHEIPATVVEVTGNMVTIDYNHPMAGHHITYYISILKIDKN